MVRVGPLTAFARTFMSGGQVTINDPDGRFRETLNVGHTYVTAGFDGITVREFPDLGLQPLHRTPFLNMHDENRLWYGKFYRISQNHKLKSHPVVRLSHRPLIQLNDLLTRAYDPRIASRSCIQTKVS